MQEELGRPKFNRAYTGRRQDIVSLVPKLCSRVLDVGCGTGEVGNQIKAQRTGDISVVGIELNEEMAQVATAHLDHVIVGDVEHIDLQANLGDWRFDTIIVADILEHLRDPWTTLENLISYLTDDGVIIISIPNVRHITTLFSLIIKSYWPYRDRGIHDVTHLRFFARQNLHMLVSGAGLEMIQVRRLYRLTDRPHRINKVALLLALPLLRDFVTYQYVIVARKSRTSRKTSS